MPYLGAWLKEKHSNNGFLVSLFAWTSYLSSPWSWGWKSLFCFHHLLFVCGAKIDIWLGFDAQETIILRPNGHLAATAAHMVAQERTISKIRFDLDQVQIQR